MARRVLVEAVRLVPLRRSRTGSMSLKKLLVIVALGTVLAAPAYAQHDPNDPNDPSTHHRVRGLDQQQSKVPAYVGDIYYGRNNNDPSGPRWKTLHHRAHSATRSAKRK
jgi:hypothetical protein